MKRKHIHETNWFRSIFVHGKWNLLSSVISKGAGFFLLPVYTRYFDEAEYGLLSSITSIGQLVGIGVTLYLDMAFIRFIHDVRGNKEETKTLVSTYYTFLVLWGPVFTAIAIYGCIFLIKDLAGVSVWSAILLAYIPQTIAQLGLIGISFFLQNLEVKKASLVLIFCNLANLAVTLILIIGFDIGFRARLIGNSVSSLILFIIITYYFIKNRMLILRIDYERLKSLLKYSLPLFPLVMQYWIVNYSNRIIIAHSDSLSSTAVYSFAFQIAQMAHFFQESATRVITPMSISGLIHDRERSMHKLLDSSKALFLIMAYISLCAALFSREILQMILLLGRGNTSYLDGAVLLAILVSVNIFTAQHKLYSSIVFFHKKTWILSSGGLIVAGLNLVLNSLLIPRYGRMAAACIAVFVEAIYCGWILYWAIRIDQFRLHYPFYITVAILFGIPVFVLYYWMPELLQINQGNFIIKTIVCLMFFGIVYKYLSKKYRANRR